MGWPYLPLAVVLAVEPHAADVGAAPKARGPDGFVRAYEAVMGDPTKLGLTPKYPKRWDDHRADQIRQQLGAAAHWKTPMWEHGVPTRRHLSLVMWGYSPDPADLRRWLMRSTGREHPPAPPQVHVRSRARTRAGVLECPQDPPGEEQDPHVPQEAPASPWERVVRTLGYRGRTLAALAHEAGLPVELLEAVPDPYRFLAGGIPVHPAITKAHAYGWFPGSRARFRLTR